MLIQRGQINKITFRVFTTATGVGVTNLTGWGTNLFISKDGANWANCTNTPVQVDASDQPGVYTLELTATECDAQHVLVCITGFSSPTAYVATTHSISPSLWQGVTAPAWQANVLGAGHTSTTDSMERIRNAMDVALNPIVRSA